MSKAAVDLSLTQDPRESPVYSISEAAHYLRLPQATLRSWVVGRYYLAGGKKRFFRPVIDLADQGRRLLSFMNEAHLRRIERDASGLAVRLYLFTRKREPEAPKVIVVDPYVSFGRPVLVSTG